MDTSAVWIALIAALASLISTIAMPFVINRNALKMKEADYARQDEIERRVAEAALKADEVARRAKEAANLLAENTALQAEAAKTLIEKVDEVKKVSNVIHTLVNSKLTITTQRLYDRTAASLALMHQYSPEKTAQIGIIEAELAELSAELADRKVSQDKVVTGNLDK